MHDAGMTPKDIDGVSMLWGVAGAEPAGLDVVDGMDAAAMLGITPVNWHTSVGMSPAFVGAAVQSIAAVKAGFYHTCIAFRVIPQRMNTTASREQARAGPVSRVRGDGQFTAPYGGESPGMGAQMRRHMALFGTTEEHFGAHVVAQRYHASLNPEALLRDPLTIEDYLKSRYMAKPARLLDCD